MQGLGQGSNTHVPEHLASTVCKHRTQRNQVLKRPR